MPLGEVLRVQIGDVQKAIFADAKVDECRLDGGLDVGDAALVNIADVGFRAGTLHVEFFEQATADDGDADFLAFDHVDEHIPSSWRAARRELFRGHLVDLDILGKRGQGGGIARR